MEASRNIFFSHLLTIDALSSLAKSVDGQLKGKKEVSIHFCMESFMELVPICLG